MFVRITPLGLFATVLALWSTSSSAAGLEAAAGRKLLQKSKSSCSDPWVTEALTLTNGIRKAQNPALPDYKCDDTASKLAHDLAMSMCKDDHLTHVGFEDRCKTLGNKLCGENVLYNKDSSKTAAQTAIGQWEASPGHYENLVARQYFGVGMAYYQCPNGKVFWAAIYGNNLPIPAPGAKRPIVAIPAAVKVPSMCLKGGFRKVKWMFNVARFRDNIPMMVCDEPLSAEALVQAEQMCKDGKVSNKLARRRCKNVGNPSYCDMVTTHVTDLSIMSSEKAADNFLHDANDNAKVADPRARLIGVASETCKSGPLKNKMVWAVIVTSAKGPAIAPSTAPAAAKVTVPPKKAPACAKGWDLAAGDLMNKVRKDNKQKALKCDAELTKQSAQHSKAMCQKGALTHNKYLSRCSAAGYKKQCAEIVAVNKTNSKRAADDTVKQWAKSKADFNSMINKKSTHYGIAHFKCKGGRVFWTALFAAK